MTAAVLLEVAGISSGYGKAAVLHDVSIVLRAGEIVALVGPNGAGKTTFLRTISGELPAMTGAIDLEGVSVVRSGVRQRLVRGIVHVPEHRRLFRNLSIRENLELGAAVLGSRARRHVAARMDRVVELFPVLGERLDLAASTLSGGQQQMLAIGRGLMSGPKVMLMDEPSLGLAPSMVERLMDAFIELAAEGTAILLVEQFVESALSIASRGYVLRDGRIELAGTSTDLLAEPEQLAASYFGVAMNRTRFPLRETSYAAPADAP